MKWSKVTDFGNVNCFLIGELCEHICISPLCKVSAEMLCFEIILPFSFSSKNKHKTKH